MPAMNGSYVQALDAFISATKTLELHLLSGDELGGFLRRTTSVVLDLDTRCPLALPVYFGELFLMISVIAAAILVIAWRLAPSGYALAKGVGLIAALFVGLNIENILTDEQARVWPAENQGESTPCQQ